MLGAVSQHPRRESWQQGCPKGKNPLLSPACSAGSFPSPPAPILGSPNFTCCLGPTTLPPPLIPCSSLLLPLRAHSRPCFSGARPCPHLLPLPSSLLTCATTTEESREGEPACLMPTSQLLSRQVNGEQLGSHREKDEWVPTQDQDLLIRSSPWIPASSRGLYSASKEATVVASGRWVLLPCLFLHQEHRLVGCWGGGDELPGDRRTGEPQGARGRGRQAWP